MPSPSPAARELRRSHDRLAATVGALSPAQLAEPSYCTEWTVAQVISHLGSGAEIFSAIVTAALDGQALPGPETFPPVWDRWNARSAPDVVAAFVDADADLAGQMAALDDDDLATQVSLFGMDLDLAMIVGMRLSEHTLHSFDIVALSDPGATLDLGATELLVDTLGLAAGRTGHPGHGPGVVRVETTGPDRTFTLVTADAVSLEAGAPADADASITLPAESLVRLVVGRLDPRYTPDSVRTDGVDLDDLRVTFPGL